MASLPNLKGYIDSVLNPKIRALAILYEEQVSYMQKRIADQDNSIMQAQEQVVALSSLVLDLQEHIIRFQSALLQVQKNSFSAQQVRDLLRRVRELDYIVGNLYTKVLQMGTDGSVDFSDLPSFNNPWIIGDYVKTEAELNDEWRQKNGISQYAILTEEQEKAWLAYKDLYYKTHFTVDGIDTGADGFTTKEILDYIQKYQEHITALYLDILNHNRRIFGNEISVLKQRTTNDITKRAIATTSKDTTKAVQNMQLSLAPITSTLTNLTHKVNKNEEDLNRLIEESIKDSLNHSDKELD